MKKECMPSSESGQKYKTLKHYNTPGHVHELTFFCYYRYDYLGGTVACELFLSELKRARAKHDFQLWAYVLMPNHVHLLIWPHQSTYDSARILNDTKGRMAKQYRYYILENEPEKFEKYKKYDKSKRRNVFRFWQAGGGFDRNLRNGIAIHKSIEYIEANPVRRNLPSSPSEYRWSSAYARLRESSLIPNRFNMSVAMLNPQVQRIGAM
ncbi:MAG: hypothetical protein GF398_01490 [Chitinivibrionales bacterium]|nr:hypothetical protein [Chitinivibrionales bacterium]